MWTLNFAIIFKIVFPVAVKYGLPIQMFWQVISMKIPFVECQMGDRSKSHVGKKLRPTHQSGTHLKKSGMDKLSVDMMMGRRDSNYIRHTLQSLPL